MPRYSGLGLTPQPSDLPHKQTPCANSEKPRTHSLPVSATFSCVTLFLYLGSFLLPRSNS